MIPEDHYLSAPLHLQYFLLCFLLILHSPLPPSIPQPKQTILSAGVLLEIFPFISNRLRRVNTFLVAIHSLTQFNLTWDLSCALTENALAKISSDLIAKFKSFFSIHLLKLDRVGHHLFSGKDGSPTTLFTSLTFLSFSSAQTLHFTIFLTSLICPHVQIFKYDTIHTCVSVCVSFPLHT